MIDHIQHMALLKEVKVRAHVEYSRNIYRFLVLTKIRGASLLCVEEQLLCEYGRIDSDY